MTGRLCACGCGSRMARSKSKFKLDHIPVEPLKLRIWRSVLINPDTGCWEWQGCVHRQGYGSLSVSGRRVMAHRAAYLCLVGPIPDGLELDHLCRVKHCVNPDHLEPVTRHENMLRSGIWNRVSASVCSRGHERTGDHCKVCKRMADAERYQRNLKKVSA
jgi:hypothetical protein